MASKQQLRTTVTDLLKIPYPVLLAGMNVAAGPKLATAVANAGGLGVIGGVGYTPDMLREQIAELKSFLTDKNAPFGLNELVDIIIDSGAKLFVSAISSYAQGGEGSRYTSDIPTTILILAVVELVKGKKSLMTSQLVQTIAAALMLGASTVQVGTRFILTNEAEAVRIASHDDNVRTIIFTGRLLRENNRATEIKELTAKGVIPVEHDFETLGNDIDNETIDNARPFLMGKAAAVVNEKKSAKAVVDELVTDAVAWIHKGEKMVAKL
ncbi:hypothetical protein BGZ57DRAFT_943514 [Hyaloscypha finlandica]|nr:hypothetical protein BGZ57DRAFT_943514 [Hyaloscypha finlandica]